MKDKERGCLRNRVSAVALVAIIMFSAGAALMFDSREDMDAENIGFGDKNILYVTVTQTTVMVYSTWDSTLSSISGDVVIPETVAYKGITYTVVSISSYAFEDCTKMTSITIPKSVTFIGDYVFSHCDGLKRIIVDENNAYYSSQDGVLYNKDKTTLIVCPPDKTSVTIPNSVKTISRGAFEYCTKLTYLTIPDGVTYINQDAFWLCLSLTGIVVGGNNAIYSSQDGVLYSKDKSTLIVCPAGKTSVMIPDSVTSISGNAFQSCMSLTSLTIPDSVTYIGENAFTGCSSMTEIIVDENNANYSSQDGVLYSNDKSTLIVCPAGKTSVTIPDSVTHIGNYAFTLCEKLTSVAIPDSVTHIGEGAFMGCRELTSVTIPESMEIIGEGAFWLCSSMTEIIVDENNANYSSQNGILFNKDKSWLYACPAGKISVTIPGSVTNISLGAFASCTGLTSLTIPVSVTYIGKGAFEKCDKLVIYAYCDASAILGGLSSLTAGTYSVGAIYHSKDATGWGDSYGVFHVLTYKAGADASGDDVVMNWGVREAPYNGSSFSRDGYKVTGWSLTDGGEKVDMSTINDDTTLYAVWEADEGFWTTTNIIIIVAIIALAAIVLLYVFVIRK